MVCTYILYNKTLQPAADRWNSDIYSLLLEGVLVAKKDFNLPKHGEIDTKNLYVSVETGHKRNGEPS